MAIINRLCPDPPAALRVLFVLRQGCRKERIKTVKNPPAIDRINRIAFRTLLLSFLLEIPFLSGHQSESESRLQWAPAGRRALARRNSFFFAVFFALSSDERQQSGVVSFRQFAWFDVPS